MFPVQILWTNVWESKLNVLGHPVKNYHKGIQRDSIL